MASTRFILHVCLSADDEVLAVSASALDGHGTVESTRVLPVGPFDGAEQLGAECGRWAREVLGCFAFVG